MHPYKAGLRYSTPIYEMEPLPEGQASPWGRRQGIRPPAVPSEATFGVPRAPLLPWQGQAFA